VVYRAFLEIRTITPTTKAHYPKLFYPIRVNIQKTWQKLTFPKVSETISSENRKLCAELIFIPKKNSKPRLNLKNLGNIFLFSPERKKEPLGDIIKWKISFI
jgi:hypothetical protein